MFWSVARVWRQATFTPTTAIVVAVTISLWAGLVQYGEALRKSAIDTAIVRTKSQTHSAVQQLHRTISGVDSSLRFIAEFYRRDWAQLAPKEWLSDIRPLARYEFDLTVVSPAGRIAATTSPYFKALDEIAGVPDFLTQLADPDVQLVITLLNTSAGHGEPQIGISRQLRHADGSAGGLIIATLDAARLLPTLSGQEAIQSATVWVFGVNGALLATRGNLDRVPEASLSRTLQQLTSGGDEAGSRVAVLDTVQAFHVLEVLQGYPLAIGIAVPEVEVLARPERDLTRYETLAVMGTGILLFLGVSGVVRQRRIILFAEAEAAARATLDLALGTMSQGIAMFDRDRRIVLRNERYCQLYGLSLDDVALGMTNAEIVEKRIGRGIFAASPGEYRELASHVTKQCVRVDRLSNGRAIRLRREPLIGGGWVTTHEDITDSIKASEDLEFLAHRDPLTGLANRAFLMKRMSEALSSFSGTSVALLLIDLDRFKEVNDTLGHPAGDQLLLQVADRLRGAVRQTDLVARLGGDEFAVLCETTGNVMVATALAERLVDLLGEHYLLGRTTVTVSASVGISQAEHGSFSVQELFKRADLALYAAKGAGRSRFRIFEPPMLKRAMERHELERDLRLSLKDDGLQFSMVYQPIVSIESGRAVEVEALLRWRHPVRGDVSPSEFIPIAEETGLIHELGTWIFSRVCRDAARLDGLAIAINLSPRQLGDHRLAERIIEIAALSHVPMSRFVFEITETAILQESDCVFETLKRLKSAGARVALDDFGTGFSSLGHLRSFPFDKVKIDKSFVSSAVRIKDCEAIIRAVAQLSIDLGVSCTAEGIETRQQLELVRRAGCHQAQGFLFSRPLPLSDLTAALQLADAA